MTLTDYQMIFEINGIFLIMEALLMRKQLLKTMMQMERMINIQELFTTEES